MIEQTLDFYHGSGRAGCFQTTGYPEGPGIYAYMPYRSLAHYEMQMKLRDLGFAECSYMTKEGVVRFKVIGCPAYGRLELSEFMQE
jgi:hypothetical protein